MKNSAKETKKGEWRTKGQRNGTNNTSMGVILRSFDPLQQVYKQPQWFLSNQVSHPNPRDYILSNINWLDQTNNQ